ncbi:hypothetical protein [Phormidium sp. CCY1219]|uniref:hypothetical protein n=1 Tax=Phormidium sp. CCY1219 TaxID=2886104 RepID=UPI002D1F5309|nr:hypothetical protein [Phormidium sp. CCY1219]MEB3830116.1 hypothetical protein [Phormidium sp. CCY1219]
MRSDSHVAIFSSCWCRCWQTWVGIVAGKEKLKLATGKHFTVGSHGGDRILVGDRLRNQNPSSMKATPRALTSPTFSIESFLSRQLPQLHSRD